VKQANYCGTIIIVGKPNVGKSTIINKLVKNKISIVSKRPHTTQNNIIGIHHDGLYQSIYIDTPGISYKHTDFVNKKTRSCINKLCNNSELILLILEKTNWTLEDELVLNTIKHNTTPIIAIINKNDKILNKIILLPYMDYLRKKYLFKHILPISAKTGENIDVLYKIVKNILPMSKHQFSSSQITNYSLNFKIEETIREKFIFYLGNELSYSIKTKVENIYFNTKNICVIRAIIIVKNNQHKKIVIGNKGKKIKLCGTIARKTLEKYLKKSVHLILFVAKNDK